MSTRGKILWVVLGVLVLVIGGGIVGLLLFVPTYRLPVADPYDPKCKGQVCATWAEFRNRHPYPYQTIAGKRLDDKSVVIVLSEPAPVMTKAALGELVGTTFDNDLLSSEHRRWFIGTDGWVEDLVLHVKAGAETSDDPLSDPLLRERVALLHRALFGTTFGADFELIGDKPESAQPTHNLQVSPAEVAAWLGDGATIWREVGEEGAGATWSQLCANSVSGAFASPDGTMVLLTFPTKILGAAQTKPDMLESLRVPFRRFAVASDGIFGGVWTDSGQTAILARARTVPQSSVAPLRFETFALLASAQGRDELSQSYERNSVFAGKLDSGPYAARDWAPIFLSGPLIDTELGALLNITDQLLKSWSEAGQIEYLYFTYPKPQTFAFKGALSDILRKKIHTKSVLFNWNTAGSAAVVRHPQMSILTAKQTGALPVTYGGDSKRKKAGPDELLTYEEQAYRYFAGLRDPNLARVVQYTVIYQLFRAIAKEDGDDAVSHPLEEDVAARAEAHAGMSARAKQLIDDIEGDKVKAPKEFQAKLRQFRSAHPALEPAQVAAVLADRFSPEARKLYDEQRAAFDSVESKQSAFNSDVERYNAGVAKAKANPEGVTQTEVDELNALGASIEARRGELEAEEQTLTEKQNNDLVDDLRKELQEIAEVAVDREDVRAKYVAANKAEPSGWIKTPSVVLSWNSRDTLASVGGHNLDARAIRFELAPDVNGLKIAQGKDGEVVLRYNPSEADAVESHAGDLAREVEHRGVRDVEVLQKVIAEVRPIRTRAEALEVTSNDLASMKRVGRLGGREFFDKNEFVDELRKIGESNPCCVFVAEGEGESSFIVEKNPTPPPGAIAYEARDTSSIGDHLVVRSERGGASKPIIFFDQPDAHVQALVTGAVEGKEPNSVNRIAEWLHSSDGMKRSSGIVETDLRGRDTALRVIDTLRQETRAVLERIGVYEPPATWQKAVVHDVDQATLENILKAANWNTEEHGIPKAVQVTFEPGAPADIPEIEMVAGYDKQAADAGEAHLRAAHESAVATAREKGATLARYLATVRNDLRGAHRAELKRLLLVVKNKETTTLLTRLIRAEGHHDG